MEKKIIIGLIFIIGVVSPFAGEAAYFHFSPSEGGYHKNENFKVSVLVNAEEAVNAVSGAINFPAEYLEAISVNANGGGSLIDLWVQKPSFSNAGANGNVQFEGVILNPGFKGSAGKIMEVVFRVKKEGSAELRFGEFAILANDGLGTNIAESNGSAKFTFLPARTLPSEKSLDAKKIEQEIKSAVDEKIKSIAEKFELIKTPEEEGGVLKYWDLLPKWVKVSVLIFVGAAALILSLIILSLGAVVVVWILSYGWRRRGKASRWLEAAPEAAEKSYRRFWRKIFSFTRRTDEEIEQDIKYAARQIKHDFREAEEDLPFSQVLKDYWLSLLKIVKYIFKRKRP